MAHSDSSGGLNVRLEDHAWFKLFRDVALDFRLLVPQRPRGEGGKKKKNKTGKPPKKGPFLKGKMNENDPSAVDLGVPFFSNKPSSFSHTSAEQQPWIGYLSQVKGLAITQA